MICSLAVLTASQPYKAHCGMVFLNFFHRHNPNHVTKFSSKNRAKGPYRDGSLLCSMNISFMYPRRNALK